MLYWLLYQQLFLGYAKQYPFLSPLRLFQYSTFRIAFASLTALFLCIIIGPWLIRKLREFQIGQHIREDGPKSHQIKAGTPTMGGVLIIVSIVVPTLLWTDLRNPFVWVLLLSSLAFAGIGFADDYLKIVRKQSLGLTVREKIGLQVLVCLAAGIFLLYLRNISLYTTNLTVPFFKFFTPDLLIDSLFDTPLFF